MVAKSDETWVAQLQRAVIWQWGQKRHLTPILKYHSILLLELNFLQNFAHFSVTFQKYITAYEYNKQHYKCHYRRNLS